MALPPAPVTTAAPVYRTGASRTGVISLQASVTLQRPGWEHVHTVGQPPDAKPPLRRNFPGSVQGALGPGGAKSIGRSFYRAHFDPIGGASALISDRRGDLPDADGFVEVLNPKVRLPKGLAMFTPSLPAKASPSLLARASALGPSLSSGSSNNMAPVIAILGRSSLIPRSCNGILALASLSTSPYWPGSVVIITTCSRGGFLNLGVAFLAPLVG